MKRWSSRMVYELISWQVSTYMSELTHTRRALIIIGGFVMNRYCFCRRNFLFYRYFVFPHSRQCCCRFCFYVIKLCRCSSRYYCRFSCLVPVIITPFCLSSSTLKSFSWLQVAPIVQKGHEGLVHHILVYQCPHDFPPNNVSHSAPCDSPDMPPDILRCQAMEPVAAWAIGGSVSVHSFVNGAENRKREIRLPLGLETWAVTQMLQIWLPRTFSLIGVSWRRQ